MRPATLALSTALLAIAPAVLAPPLAASPAFMLDPPVPPGGFAVQTDANVPFVWSDGYQVRMDVRHPVGMPGPTGWPLVVLVHGGGGSKAVVGSEAESLARAGYFTLAYDVRGQGPSMNLNPTALAHDLVGLRELIDLFEAMEAAEALYPARVDFTRIGVTGYSQGATHSWWAAQHSGNAPPPNPWRIAPFPVVSAIAPRDSAGGAATVGDAFPPNLVGRVFDPDPDFVVQPAVRAALAPLILAEDFAGVAALLTVVGMDASALLPLVDVPVLAHSSYDDKRVNPSGVLSTWELVPTTTPKRILFGTGGHGSPQNVLDEQLFSRTRRRWFDRFLKLQFNGVALDEPVRMAVTPEDEATYQDTSTLWDFREDEQGVPSNKTRRMWLGTGKKLEKQPSAGVTFRTLTHGVPAAYDIAAFAASVPGPGALQNAIALDSIAWSSEPLKHDKHLSGEVVVELGVDSGFDPDFQIHGVLLDVDPDGKERWVASGGIVALASPGTQVLTFELYVQSYVFREGHRMKLQLENLAIHRADTGSGQELKAVPYFASSTVDVVEGGANASYIDLPLLTYVEPTLVTAPLVQHASQPKDQRYTIHTSTQHAGKPFVVVFTVDGAPTVKPPASLVAPTFPLAAMIGTLGPIGAADVTLPKAGPADLATLAGLELAATTQVSSDPEWRRSNTVIVPIVID